jgi:Domain of unknown function (DUF4266)
MGLGLSTCLALSPAAASRGSLSRVFVCGVFALVAMSTAACSHVAPYERGKLAHPMMTADDLEGPAAAHVLAVHEGATGGGSLSESGCGCN